MKTIPVPADLLNDVRGASETVTSADLVFQPVGGGRTLVHKYRHGAFPVVVDQETLTQMHENCQIVVRIAPTDNGTFDAHIMRDWLGR